MKRTMRIRDLYILRASQVRSAKPGKLNDGGGLHLLTKPNGKQYWRFQWMKDGKSTTLSLGSALEMPLTDARDLAAICRQAVKDDVAPREALDLFRRGGTVSEDLTDLSR